VTLAQKTSASNLDRQLPALQSAAKTLNLRPPKGWIAALRTALGMSGTFLARRLGVSHSTLIDYEKAELSGRIQLETLRRVADALDADVVVALVPRKSVQEMLHERAREIAREEMAAVVQTMGLENQQVDSRVTEAQFEELVSKLVSEPRKLWR